MLFLDVFFFGEIICTDGASSLLDDYILFKGLSDPTIDAFPIMYFGLFTH